MRKNRVKEALQKGEAVMGPFIMLPSPALVEIAGYAGFDFAVIDMEHGPTGFETAEQMCRAADASGIVSFVRVPENRPTHVLRALEIGAMGVVVPLVRTREEAQEVVSAGKYHPMGSRGFAPITRGANYGAMGGVNQVFKTANSETVLAVQIEDKFGVENAEAICSVDGIDVVFIGPGDLSQSLGVPGRFDDPALAEATERVIKTCLAHGKIPGIFEGDPERARQWVERGVRFVGCAVDILTIYSAWKQLREGSLF